MLRRSDNPVYQGHQTLEERDRAKQIQRGCRSGRAPGRHKLRRLASQSVEGYRPTPGVCRCRDRVLGEPRQQ